MKKATKAGMLGLLLAAGCGGSAAPPPVAPAPPSPPPSPAPVAAQAAGASAPTPGTEDDDEETTQRTKAAVTSGKAATSVGGVGRLENLLPKPAAGSAKGFPAKTADDATCHKSAGLTGTPDKDYATLGDKCGTAAGMKEYVKPVSGKLDEAHPRDAWDFQMMGGYCYRFFVTGETTLTGVDLRVQRPTGALVSMSETKGSILLMDPDRTWCKTHDREFHLVVEGHGKGRYTLGVWARPK